MKHSKPARAISPTEARMLALTAQVLGVQRKFTSSKTIRTALVRSASMISNALCGECKILLCGNGGSAADAQHIAAELVGRFKYERRGFPAVALTTDSSITTSVANDYGFDDIFRRQVVALGQPGDILIAYSTSGTSPNVLSAVDAAHGQHMMVIAMTGAKGLKLKSAANVCIMAPSTDTARIQECHAVAGHIICDLVERELMGLE